MSTAGYQSITLDILMADGHPLVMANDASANLGNNIKQLREARGLTQAQLSKQAGVPRPTWANLESGVANPTLSVLIKVANALSVSLEELVGPPRPSAKHYAAASIPTRRRGKVTVRKLLPEATAGFVLEKLELPPGSSMTGIPHTPGTREYLTCESGAVELSESGRVWTLDEGDVVVFRGDQKHGYRNPGRRKAIAYSIVALTPVAQ
jgi:transcriptional regulator with XRE-family HTH domain